MKRAFLPALIASTVLLTTACSSPSTPKDSANDALTPQPPVSAPATPPSASPGTTDQAQAPAPGTAAADAPATVPPAGAPADKPAATPVSPQPAIKWYPKGIGLPLVSDDPAAQGKKVVMLTFDDGPSNTGSTAQILDELAEANVKAMFCITGYGAKHKELVEREFREGHVLIPHTVTHADLATLSEPELREEIGPVYKIIEEVTGEKPKWLRPPFGSYNQKVIDLAKNEYGMQILNWTDGSLDWEGGKKDPQVIIDEVMKQLYPGGVVLMHDTLQHTADALPGLIKAIRAEGYEFVVLNNH